MSNILHSGMWNLPQSLKEKHGDLCQLIEKIEILDQDDDELVWQSCVNGELTIKEAYNFYMEKAT